jgi:hypothetical protein
VAVAVAVAGAARVEKAAAVAGVADQGIQCMLLPGPEPQHARRASPGPACAQA